MGSSISKVSCGDINIHKKMHKPSHRRPTVRIDKSKIGIPTDFRHTYHVGNNSPVMDEFADTSSAAEAASILTDSDFMATMAQITDALQKFPVTKSTTTMRRVQYTKKSPSAAMVTRVAPSTHNLSSSKLGSQSDQQIARRPVPSLLLLDHSDIHGSGVLQKKSNMSGFDLSASMVIQSSTNKFDNDMFRNFSDKEKNVLQFTKSSSIQNMERVSRHRHHSFVPKSVSKEELESNNMTMTDLTGGYYEFSSCLQSRIDAQIVELARARSKNKSARSPRNNMVFDKPSIMI